MSEKRFFTPGPTQLYPKIGQFMQEGLQEDIGSISHRSNAFKSIYGRVVEGVKGVLGLPDGYRVLFLGSATEAFERIAYNLVRQHSYHFVNGSFSSRFYNYLLAAHKQPVAYEVPFGQIYDLASVNPPQTPELVTFTQNETSNGVAWPMEKIAELRKLFPEALIAMDGVSSLPQPPVDFSIIDTALFSVQKGLGLPAGLGVWLVNEKAVEKAASLKKEGQMIGAHHDLATLVKYGDKNQTAETPNVFLIYLLARVCEDLLQRGMEKVRAEGRQKMQLLYDFVAHQPGLDIYVQEEAWRSETVVVAQTELTSSEVNERLAKHNMMVGQGYKQHKETQLRIANFTSHSVSEVEQLIAILRKELSL